MVDIIDIVWRGGVGGGDGGVRLGKARLEGERLPNSSYTIFFVCYYE